MQDERKIRLNGMPLEACLLAYGEGVLPVEEARAVEAFLAENADWAAQVALLRDPTGMTALVTGGSAPDVEDGTCPSELKARLLRPVEGRVSPARSVRPAWFARHVRRRTYQAAAAVAGLLLVAGLVLRTVERPSEIPSATNTVRQPAFFGDNPASEPLVEPVAGVEAGSAGEFWALSAAVAVHETVKRLETEAETTSGAPSVGAMSMGRAGLSRERLAVPPLSAGNLPAEWLEARKPSDLLARAEVGGVASASVALAPEVTGRPASHAARGLLREPSEILARAYVTLACRMERQRIRRQIKREVTASLQAAAETSADVWNIYN